MEGLWKALRESKQEALAPILVRHGVRSVSGIGQRASELIEAGIQPWQIEAVLATWWLSSLGEISQFQSGKRASLAAALEAAQPNQRQKSLEALDQDVLARSTAPSVEARLRTYLAVCRAWEVDPWPLSAENVRAFAASLKQGGYKSAGAYFQVICTYQQRELRTPVPQLLRQCIRDYLRSIQRGLGVDKLKDSFNLLRLGDIPIDDDEGRFCLGNVSHSRDMCIICGWFMLRESEISSARLGHLSLHAQTVTLAIPLHKTDIQGHMTERSLSCSCRVRRHPLCVWHAAERHLIRMRENLGTLSALRFPLFPTEDGRTPGKHQMVAVFRRTIGAAGIPLEKQDGSGRWVPRFHGHVLQVSGAQMLAGAGVSTQLIQLLGRWKSTSVLRYTQDAGLAVVPDLPHMVLNAADAQARVCLLLHPPSRWWLSRRHHLVKYRMALALLPSINFGLNSECKGGGLSTPWSICGAPSKPCCSHWVFV